MPLGIVKDEDYEKDLEISNVPKDISKQEDTPSSNSEIKDSGYLPAKSNPIIEAVNRTAIGRGQGNTEVPQSIRKLIGESSIEEGSSAATAIGRFLGLSQSSISAYQNGATSTATYNKPNEELSDHLQKTRKKISKRAAGKLFKALDVIDENKLGVLSALEASTVAKNMSAIIKHMEPDLKSIGNQFNGPVITFYAPHLVPEEKFDVININE